MGGGEKSDLRLTGAMPVFRISGHRQTGLRDSNDDPASGNDSSRSVYEDQPDIPHDVIPIKPRTYRMGALTITVTWDRIIMGGEF